MVLKYLIEKEFRQMVRNPIIPRLIVIFPCMMMLLMPWAATLEVKNSRLCIIDLDGSSLSRRLTEKVCATTSFVPASTAVHYDDALLDVKRGEADVILELPPKMEYHMMRGEPVDIQVSANAINGTKGALSASYLTTVSQEFFAQEGGPQSVAMPVRIVEKSLFNPRLDYKVFMVPALMVMLLSILCAFLPALNIVSEKEVGTIEQLNVTPLRKFDFILGKLLPYWVVGLVVLTLCFLLAHWVYDLTPAGSWPLLYFFACIYILIMSGVGLVISNYSATMQQAMFVTFFFLLIFVLLSGLFTPITSMPVWAQWIARINPLTHFNQVMRMLYLKGSTLTDLLPQLYILLAFMAFFNTWAMLSYKKTH